MISQNLNLKALDQEIQSIANKVKSDVEKELQRIFKTFDVVEHHPVQNENPQGTSYSMKVRTDDTDNSHLRLMTSRRDPFSAWETVVDEFFRGKTPFDHMFSAFDPFNAGFSSIQALADSVKRDIERDLNRKFRMFDVMESYPILTDPGHTSYFMRVKTDDNGFVRVKTIKKTPGSEWQTHVEEYNRGQPRLEGKGEKAQAIGTKEKQGQDMEIEDKGKRDEPVEIQEESYKGSVQDSASA